MWDGATLLACVLWQMGSGRWLMSFALCIYFCLWCVFLFPSVTICTESKMLYANQMHGPNTVLGVKGLRAIWRLIWCVWEWTCIIQSDSPSDFLYLFLSTDRSDCCSAHHRYRGDICQSNMGARVGCHPHLAAGQHTETQRNHKAMFHGFYTTDDWTFKYLTECDTKSRQFIIPT